MNPWWNLPFGLFVILALWCRAGASERALGPIGALLDFFGAGGAPIRQAGADLFGIAGTSGLLFVAWGDHLEAVPDAWMLVDAVLSSLGLGLVGAWVLARVNPDRVADDTDPGSGALSRELTMMEVDEIPRRVPAAGSGSGPVGGGSPPDPR